MPYLGNVPSSFNVGTDNINNDAITTAKIADGAILNADVNAAAAIAGTKISPDFGSQNILTTGTATAASLIPTSSTVPTNGLYLPAANSVAISTNGTGRLFVDASGKIGIGGTPNYNLDLYAGSANFQGANQGIYWDSATNKCAILADSGALKFATGTSSVVERLRITSAGLVGVGTSSPSSLLELFSAGDATLTLTGNVAGANVASVDFKRNGGTVNASIQSVSVGSNDAGALYFSTRPNAGSLTERLRITPTGLVGIGTSSPGALLDLAGGAIRLNSTHGIYKANADGYAYFSGGTGLTAGGTIFCFGESHVSNANEIHFRNSSNLTRAVIDSSGRVGIGTTLPSQLLEVAGSVGNIQLASSGAEITFTRNGPSAITASGASGSLLFQTGGTNERARIDSSGRLLVGTSSARNNITQFSDPYLQIEGNYSRSISVLNNENNGNASGIALSKIRSTSVLNSGDIPGIITFGGYDGTQFREAANIQAVIDGTPGAGDMPGRLVFSVTRDNQASPTSRLWMVNNGYTYLQSEGQVFAAATTQGAGTSFEVFVGGYGATGGSYNSLNTSIKIWSNGNVQNTNNSYTALSDIKLKENVVDAGSQWGDLKALRVRNYNLKEGQTHRQIGLIAQEVEPISPGLVYESPDRDEDGNDLGTVTKSVNYSVLYMKAVKALQEAMERIETLEAKVAALESA